jgi:hypothetical protein
MPSETDCFAQDRFFVAGAPQNDELPMDLSRDVLLAATPSP